MIGNWDYRCRSLLSITSNVSCSLCVSSIVGTSLWALSYLTENSGIYLDKVNVKVCIKCLLDHANFIYMFNIISDNKTL